MQNKVLLTVGLTLLTAATVFLSQQGIQTDDTLIKAEWKSWQLKHGKRYGYGEDAFRFQIFQSNYLFVAKHNALHAAGLESYDTELNQFADLSNEEFQAQYTTYKRSDRKPTSIYRAKGLKVPTDVDHRDSGLVGPVKDQGQCGSCWAFSAVGSIETALKLKGVKDVNLSEQELVDCSTPEYGFVSTGCDGGEMYDAFDYVVKNQLAIQSQYPYTGKDQACKSDKTTTRHGISKWTRVQTLSQEAFVEASAGNAVSIAINASGLGFQLYRSGVFNPRTCGSTKDDLNHGIVIVGYHPTYYIVRNSWGTGWGINGYMNIARVAAPEGVCGIQIEGEFAIA